MRVWTTTIVCAVAAVACAKAFAQGTSPAFTATGTNCDQVSWSRESLTLHPQTAKACEEVMQRDFESEARRAPAEVLPIGPPAPAEPGLLAQEQLDMGALLPPEANPLPLMIVAALAVLAFSSALTLRR